MPSLRLRIDPEDFAYDHFIMGLPIVSASLAALLALSPDQAQFLAVDCSACPPAVCAKGYQVMNLQTFANPIDRDRTGPGYFVDLDTPDGPTFAWVRPDVGPHSAMPTIA